MSLSPPQTLTSGKDILKKSERKNRFLFSFPGLLAPSGGGKIRAFKDLGTKNPVLYLGFPQIVFSDAWWIGTQAENPEEAQLDFPKELTEGQHA
ncbi:DNA-binding protein RHL1-like [Prunus avium]|uniref:DNA-binding protein RHL1-like n=1 Tax=Prunus avium TaxID=42229 RepID=A0A6P5SSI0_PRUAV|nr:DNA-binding protein RHL1-like [Prunus avium]